MSDNEVKALIFRINKFEAMLEKELNEIANFESHYETELPIDSWHKVLVRIIKRHLEEMYEKLRFINANQLEVALQL